MYLPYERPRIQHVAIKCTLYVGIRDPSEAVRPASPVRVQPRARLKPYGQFEGLGREMPYGGDVGRRPDTVALHPPLLLTILLADCFSADQVPSA